MTTIMNNNRKTQVEEFEQTKLGVKGLIDSGITQIPPIFHHPPENLIPQPDPTPNSDPIPVINLLNTPREELVNRIGEASRKYGFFQVVNHGVGVNVLDNLVKGIRRFHELPGEERRKYYGRGVETGCNYFSNVDLFVSKAASWIDTLQLRLGPSIVNVDAIPQICRDEILEWDKGVKQLGELLLGLFSEGLGTNVGRLKELSCLESRVMVGHYYPYCPEPEKTVGIASHADPNVFTVLLQDQVGGLQVKHDGKWVDVKPIPGALVINVGDLLQQGREGEGEGGEGGGREEVVEWAEEVKKLGELLLGLFSEGLGVRTDRLKELTCLETRTMVGQCYPYCPEPEKTVGIISHADPGIFTVLLQDHIGGLQIKHDGNWLDVKPTPGALIINVGDLLQVLSNDKYTSADHRVYANYLRQPRYSVGVLFNPSNREQVAGPFAELVSAEEPVLYREFILLEFFKRFMTMQLDGKTLANYFRKDGE